jgi:16S rRNA C967 or C1407 C5-methylase (RsmB/RsmF family)/NOL1/NOP2/fmu family ribosome biogenesis protein
LASEIPKELLASLQTVEGFNKTSFQQVHVSGEQVISVRINPAKVSDISQIPFLHNIIGEKVAWTSNGFYLQQRPIFTIDPMFHAGAYYVQEASSMFLEKVLQQSCDLQRPLKVLDLCASPGGKSTLVQSLLSGDSLLISNEVIRGRAGILAENIIKWGAANVVVTNNDPKDFKKLPEFFDCIIVDAPCSGSGMFRKDAVAVEEWSLSNVTLCSQRQQRILADVIGALKPGGTLIYSTCSYSLEEDETIADWLTENYSMKNMRLSFEKEWGIVETISSAHKCYGYRFYPDKVKGEGFFIAVFKKEGLLSDGDKEIANKPKNNILTRAEEKLASEYLLPANRFNFFKWQNEVLAIPSSVFDWVMQLHQKMYIKKAGINMGSIIRNQLIPSHELVVSNVLNNNKFSSLALEDITALDYLRRKDIQPNTDIRGWAIVSYVGLVLGLVKILPNRLNNYYPKEWRILNK